MAKKRYENPLFTIGLFILIGLALIVPFLDPTGLAGGKGSISLNSLSLLNASMLIIGLIIIIIGLIIRMAAIVALKRNFSGLLRIREGHTLVKSGVFKHVRHPAYLGAIVSFLGIQVMLSSIIGFLVTMMLVLYLVVRIKMEEKMLVEHFGAEYLEYMKTSKKLIPYVY